MRFKKITAAILTLAMVASTGCASKEEKKNAENTELIQQVTTDFFEAIREEDTDRISELTDGLEVESSFENLRMYMGSGYEAFQVFLSRTEIVEMGEVEFDYEHNKATMKTTFSFLDAQGLTDELDSPYITNLELLELLETYDSTKNKSFNLHFEYDEDSEEWYMTKDSATKIINFLGSKVNAFPMIVDISPAQAREMVEEFIYTLAETGTYDDVMVDMNINDLRVYENVVERGDGPETQEALNEFVSEYMSYVLEHDYTIEATTPYSFVLWGSAPSDEDLYEMLCAPEFFYEYYQNQLRTMYLGRGFDDMMDAQSAHVYSWLAGAVDFAEPEEYSLAVSVSPYSLEGGMLTVTSPVIAEPDRGLYEAEHSISWEDFEASMNAALEGLNSRGEMSDILYVEILDGLTPENYGYASSSTDNGSGHPDQAVGTYEQVPSWCEDGSIVYGYSNLDENGCWMHYSKEPGYLDTVGYYIGDGGVWITNYYDCEFNSGDILEVDWWLDDEQVVSEDRIFIREDGTTQVEVFLPLDNIDDHSLIEMRLWEEGHDHVISYVTLTLT